MNRSIVPKQIKYYALKKYISRNFKIPNTVSVMHLPEQDVKFSPFESLQSTKTKTSVFDILALLACYTSFCMFYAFLGRFGVPLGAFLLQCCVCACYIHSALCFAVYVCSNSTTDFYSQISSVSQFFKLEIASRMDS
jgi:hypothetical protein